MKETSPNESVTVSAMVLVMIYQAFVMSAARKTAKATKRLGWVINYILMSLMGVFRLVSY